MIENEYLTASESETEAVGAALARALREKGLPYAFVAMFGEMGVGKTAFTRGFCRALGISDVHSPTYTVDKVHLSGHGSVSISSKKRWQARFGLWGIVCQPCTRLYRRQEKK